MQRQLRRWCRTVVLAAGGAVVLVALQTATAVAYDRYNDGCQTCHGAFTDGTSPQGTVFPSNNKHKMHRDSSYMDAECNLCHTTGGFANPFIGSSDGTANNPGVGCTGCHGRDYGGSIGNSGVGLRAHHAINGVTSCAACHPGDPTALPESVQPTYYGTLDTNADDSCNSAPDYLENWSIGDTQGLDNDGDNLYDGADTETWYRDADGDGFGDPSQTQQACDQPGGYVADNSDCDDSDDTVFPGAPELCDGKDNDCDGALPPEEADADADGFAECEGDCDDNDAAVFPGATELCDGKDNDCDGVLPANEIDDDGDGLAECDGDCDDDDATVFPDAPELCDGQDNDCDGQVDEEIPAWHRDADGDGFGDPKTSQQSCDQPAGYVFDTSDCDDTDDTVFPGAPELCDGKDNDCDGALPSEEADDDSDGVINCEDNCPDEANPDQADADGDGVGDVCEAADAVPPEADEEDQAEPAEDGEADETDEAPDDQAPVSDADRCMLDTLALLALLGVTLCGFGVLPAVAVSSLGLVMIKVQRRFRGR